METIAHSAARKTLAKSQGVFVIELQSLRGIAAVIVMIHHCLRCIIPTPITHIIADVVLNAHAAVVVFFVLSGYVLSSALESTGVGFHALVIYYIRRIFRIYPALIVGVFLGGIYYTVFSGIPAGHLSTFVTSNYQPERMTLMDVLLTFLGLQMVLLPPLWTITIEIFASVVMPVITWIRLHSNVLLLLLTLVLALISFSIPQGLRLVPVYLVDFSLGACAFTFRKHLSWLIVHPIVTIIATVILMYFRQLADWTYSAPLPALIEAMASVFLILGIEKQHAHFLRWQPLVHLGNWSYSIYLVHVPIAFVLARVIDSNWGGRISVLAMSLMVLGGTCMLVIPLSAFLFRHIELRGIAMGKMAAASCLARLRQCEKYPGLL